MSVQQSEFGMDYLYVKYVRYLDHGIVCYVIRYRGVHEATVIVSKDGIGTYFDSNGNQLADRREYRELVNRYLSEDRMNRPGTPVREGRHEFVQRRTAELKAVDWQRDVLSPDVLEHVCYRAALAEWDARKA